MATNELPPFGDNLRDIRQTKGCSLQDAAERIGIAPSRLDELEGVGNQSPFCPTVERPALAYDLPPDETPTWAGHQPEFELTEQRRANSLQEQIDSLKQADRLKDEFIFAISHELRTPLSAIMGFASILETETACISNERVRGFTARILKGAERMLLLVENLLDFSRIQAGTFSIQPEETDYALLVEEAISELEPSSAENGLRVEAEVRVPLGISLDRARIHQVLANLLANAIKFTQRDGRITVRAFLKEGDLVTEVQDDGIGMEEECVQKIFTPFMQLGPGAQRRNGGVGLGLSISRTIVEAHRGTLAAESPGPGRGSTFRFSIPVGRTSPVSQPD